MTDLSASCLLIKSNSSDDLSAQLKNIGFVGLDGVSVNDDWFLALKAEAEAQRQSGWDKPSVDGVMHSAARAELGAIAMSFVRHKEVGKLLEDMLGCSTKFSPAASCYIYYQGPSDFLDIHLDRDPECAATLLLYIDASWPAEQQPSKGLELQVFSSFSSAKDEIPPPLLSIPTRENTLILGYGSITPHCRAQLVSGETAIVLAVCFSLEPIDEKDEDEDETDEFEQLITQGHQYWQQQKFEAAIDFFNQAKDFDIESDEPWEGLGFVFWSQGLFTKSLHAFQQAVINNANMASHWSNIGLCLRDLKKYEEAINAFSAAILIDPQFSPAWNEWGNVLQDLGQYDESVILYEKALAIDQKRAVVHHNLGVAYSRLGQLGSAEVAFQTALDKDPEYSHSLEEMGLLMRDKGDLTQAKDYFSRATSERSEVLLKSLDEYS